MTPEEKITALEMEQANMINELQFHQKTVNELIAKINKISGKIEAYQEMLQSKGD